MGLHQTRKLLYKEGNYQLNEKAAKHGKRYLQTTYLIGINIRNMQRTHTTQQQKINPI